MSAIVATRVVAFGVIGHKSGKIMPGVEVGRNGQRVEVCPCHLFMNGDNQVFSGDLKKYLAEHDWKVAEAKHAVAALRDPKFIVPRGMKYFAAWEETKSGGHYRTYDTKGNSKSFADVEGSIKIGMIELLVSPL